MTAAPLSSTQHELAWLDAAEAAMDIPDDQGVAPEVARRALSRIARHKARVAARESRLIRIVDEAELAKKSGAASTGSMVAGDFGGDQAASSRQVRTAKNLKVATLTEKALEAGEITFEKAEVIARTMADLPPSSPQGSEQGGAPTNGLDELTRMRVEKRLIADAQRLSLPDLRRRVMRVADIYRSRPEADADENAKLRRQEARAWQDTEFWMGPPKDGKVRFGGEMPALHADLLKNQLGAIAAPRRNEPDSDELSFNQRMGRAFCNWIEKIPTDGLPTTGGTPATLTVNLDFDDLKSQVAAATLGTGTRISASEVRRLACNHGIVPRVLDGKSVPLDQGRAKRRFTPAQRLALADRDGGCTYPGCDRPPAWTEAHHIDWWAKDGGATDLDRGTLLCARHHHWVHSEDIRIRRRDGRTEFRISGIWKTNHRWRP